MEPGSLPPQVVIAATFLPIYGLPLLLALTRALQEPWRRWAALLSPFVLALFLFWIAEPVMYNGNLLAALLYVVYFVACAAYGVVLLVVLLLTKIAVIGDR